MYFGLSVVLGVNVDEYLTGTQPGFYIYVHNQNEALIVNDLSVAAPPGMTTLVGVQKTKVCGGS